MKKSIILLCMGLFLTSCAGDCIKETADTEMVVGDEEVELSGSESELESKEYSDDIVYAETEAPSTGMMGVVNPMQKKESLAEVNEAVGCEMKEPAGYEGEITDVSYYVYAVEPIMGQFKFTLDGIEYTLRAAETDGDISGVYHEGAALGDGEAGAVFTEDGCWCRWFDGEMQYSLYSTEGNAQSTENLYAVRDALK